MTINNPTLYVASLWDLSFFDGCFGDTKIGLTDGDGLVERNGHILLLETKLPDVEIPIGQARLFSAFCRKPDCKVLVLWGYPCDPIQMQVWGTSPMRCNAVQVRAWVSRWFARANHG